VHFKRQAASGAAQPRVIRHPLAGAVSDVVEIGGGVISEWFNDS
jgi:hypothetical protein